MATVNVSNWVEFLSAIAVAGDTVNLPEDEEWDMNEIAPEGVGRITIACANVNGNGTVIKNLRSTDGMVTADGTELNGLKMTNIQGVSGIPTDSGICFAYVNGTLTMKNCVFSGMFTAAFADFITGYWAAANMSFCSFNIEMPGTAAGFCGDALTSAHACNVTPTACRFTISTPNSTRRQQISSGNAVSNCELVLYAPMTSAVYIPNFNSSTLRGNMQTATSIEAGGTSTSIYCASDAPSATVTGSLFEAVTESQMKDASYLRSIGFMIGDE